MVQGSPDVAFEPPRSAYLHGKTRVGKSHAHGPCRSTQSHGPAALNHQRLLDASQSSEAGRSARSRWAQEAQRTAIISPLRRSTARWRCIAAASFWPDSVPEASAARVLQTVSIKREITCENDRCPGRNLRLSSRRSDPMDHDSGTTQRGARAPSRTYLHASLSCHSHVRRINALSFRSPGEAVVRGEIYSPSPRHKQCVRRRPAGPAPEEHE